MALQLMLLMIAALGSIGPQALLAQSPVPSAARTVLTADLTRIDELLRAELFDQAAAALRELELRATNDADRYEVFWRSSSAVRGQGDRAAAAGRPAAEVIAIYERAEALADQAIAANPAGPRGYFWKGSNIGKAGQVRGALNSLSRVGLMRDQMILAVERDPTYAEAYFVLGQLYARLPSVISFGDADIAVSLARLSLDLMEQQLREGTRVHRNEAFAIQLASHLSARNWNQRRRDAQQSPKRAAHAAATTPFARATHYEGTIQLSPQDDRAEAREILTRAIGRLEALGNRTPAQERDLQEARVMLRGLR